MAFKSAKIKDLTAGECGYKLDSGELVAVSHTSREIAGRTLPEWVRGALPHLDSTSIVAVEHFVAARHVDATGKQRHLPSGQPTIAHYRETNMDGAATRDSVTATLLDGKPGEPKPFPSPIRRAIAAAQTISAPGTGVKKPPKK